MKKLYILVFLIAMLPIVEIRGAVPYATAHGLPLLPSFIVATVGNMVPVPFIYYFAVKILEWGKDKPYVGSFFRWCLRKGESGGKKLQAKAGRGLFVALFLFVAIPLPGTGAWTGTLAAALLKMDFRRSVIAVIAGVIVAGIIMYLVSSGVIHTLQFMKP